MHRTRSESWSQESVALRAGAVDVMGGSCAESHDNQSRAAVIDAHGSLDRLRRGVFSSVDRSESGIGCLRGHIQARMGIQKSCWRGGWAGPAAGLGLAWVGLAWASCWVG